MKKLGKLTLKELKKEKIQMSISEANSLHGGTTFEEYQLLNADGSWTGGVVEGWGYIARDCYAFEFQADYLPVSEWSDKNKISWADSAAKAAIGEVPIGGAIASMVADQYSNEMWQINSALWNSGIDGTDCIYTVYDEDNMDFYIYDENANLIYQTSE
ncbi:MAG: hypothetical protein V2I31_08600 [Mariniphaga sp.]|jgi:hypothetical protein|nr:hypothetical protein [Mariniphaga sp.]